MADNNINSIIYLLTTISNKTCKIDNDSDTDPTYFNETY